MPRTILGRTLGLDFEVELTGRATWSIRALRRTPAFRVKTVDGVRPWSSRCAAANPRVRGSFPDPRRMRGSRSSSLGPGRPRDARYLDGRSRRVGQLPPVPDAGAIPARARTASRIGAPMPGRVVSVLRRPRRSLAAQRPSCGRGHEDGERAPLAQAGLVRTLVCTVGEPPFTSSGRAGAFHIE